jgi:hypothetical protein
MGWIRQAFVASLLAATPALAQFPAATAAELQLMASNAAVIFSGQVVAISRQDTAGFVDIRFRIDTPVRNCPQAGFYVLREWAGLWQDDPARYIVGQRRLMLLTARGPSGLSSPVGGSDGAIPLVAAGVAPIANAAGIAPADTAAAPPALIADLRWIQARVIRSINTRPNSREIPMGGPAQPYSGASADWSGPIVPLATPLPAATLATLLSLLPKSLPHTTAGDARF